MLSLSSHEGPERTLNLTTWLDFIVQQGYLFIKNIYSQEYIDNTDNLKTLEDFSFEYFLGVVTLLKNENFRSLDTEKMERLKDFFEMCCEDCNDSKDIIELINEFKIVQKNERKTFRNKDQKFYKLIGFVYERVMGFLPTDNLKGAAMSENFLSNVDHIIHGTNVIHHSHITGEVIGYAHSFCNEEVRENRNQISVIAHNLFGFDFFFFLKGLRLDAFRTTFLSIGGKNLTNINFANISDQVKFFQQSLSALTSSMSDEERKGVRNECEKFIRKDRKLNEKFLACNKIDREWVLDYLPSGKGVIPYEMIQRCDSLDISPEEGSFF